MYNRQIIPITSESQWLDLRRDDLTSTEISGLFNLCPYHTKFELYHAKKDKLVLPFKDNERMQKGKRMEAFAAQEIAIKNGWEVKPMQIYARIPELMVGSSFDFEVICPNRGKGILEIKAVDYFRHKKNWSPEEIPPHIEIQARHQMLCSDYNWVCVAAFTGIYDFHEYLFDRDEPFEAGLVKAARDFWYDVANGNAPEPDFNRDGNVIAELYKNAGGDDVDLSGDNSLPDMISDYERFAREEKEFGKKKDAKKVEIHNHLGNTGSAFTASGKIDAGWTKGSDGTVITAEMVGTVIGAKKGYRKLTYKPYKGDKK